MQRCGAKTRDGLPCQKPAGWGTPNLTGRCKLHGGLTPTHMKAAQQQRALVAVETYGLPREIEPQDALIEELYRTAGHVAWLGQVVRDLEQEDLYGPVGGGEHAIPRQEPHVWVRLYQEERSHYVRIAKTCIEVGIEERRVRLAEQAGELIARVLQGVLSDFGLSDDPRAPKIVRKHLMVLEGGQGQAAA